MMNVNDKGDFKMDNISEVKTTDLFLTSYLVLKGFQFSSPPKLENHLVVFSFHKSPEVEKESFNFINKDTDVDALSLLDSFRAIRTISWEVKKGVK